MGVFILYIGIASSSIDSIAIQEHRTCCATSGRSVHSGSLDRFRQNRSEQALPTDFGFQLVNVLPLICQSRHNHRMFQAAFCLAFTYFLCSGKLTWETSSTPVLTVGSVKFAHNSAFTTIFLPPSKTNPIGGSITLTEPTIPH
ncbi:uncharacterized protein UBRO_20293 [Ustilago bromivora]|uniref:Uncharacterized protein n=1 Tax=Ustilago bromivora TaxID=307758 RepID=A0A1K0G6N6_9BASI|nr:uncharacterized protein UBRO_20293 [Ustilago bromivora]